MDKFAPIGIMGAMLEEIVSLKQAMDNPVSTHIGGREYVSGTLFGQECVVVFSRWGKVAAAATSAILISKFNVQCILFTGVAGAVCPTLNIGDVVLGTNVYQHDMDATPLFQKREIPYLGVQSFEAHPDLLNRASLAVHAFFSSSPLTPEVLHTFSIKQPTLHHGLIASGDQFISEIGKIQALGHEVPGTLAIEMEGASVAQVCFEHQIPCLIIRTISDRADHTAPIDFSKFVTQVAKNYSFGIIREIFNAVSG